jgi:hypothetical protein
MMDIIHTCLDFINAPTVARAIAFALLASFALTQGIKYTLPDFLSNASHRAATMLLAYGIAMYMCVALWPDKTDGCFPTALFVGLMTPVFYKVATFFLYKYFPGLEPVLSARPRDPT